MYMNREIDRNAASFWYVSLVAIVSYGLYYGSRYIPFHLIHQYVAFISGLVYFLSIFIGPVVIFVSLYLNRASRRKRILLTLLIPFIWMSKDVIVLSQSHPLIESLYWIFNPMYIWFLCLLSIEIGFGTLLARYILNHRGSNTRIMSPAPIILIFLGLSISVGIYAWGQGENLFSLFLDGYRFLFGYGGG
jgi:hypothetical protein